jgi:hypothetical protein
MQIEKMQIWKKILKKRKKKSKRKQVKQNRLIRIYFSFSYTMFAIFNKSQLIFNSSKSSYCLRESCVGLITDELIKWKFV